MIIFDCNGVLVDSEPLATAVTAQELGRAGFPMTADTIARYFTGRRPTDMFKEIEQATRRRLPGNFSATVNAAILQRFRAELRATAHMSYALSWLRGPKCVASSAGLDRIRASLETTDLIRFFEPHLFSGNDVANGKPAPDLFLLAAARMGVPTGDCVVVEDSPVGVAAGAAAGMAVVGFAGGSHAGPRLAHHLKAAGARAVISDMRALKSTIIDLRGW